MSRPALFVAFCGYLMWSWQPVVADDAETDGGATGSSLVVVVGAAGEPEFGELFGQWAERWATAARQFKVPCRVVAPVEDGVAAEQCDQKAAVRSEIEAAISDRPRSLWIVLIGHGTFDGRSARFNLCGDDISAQELAGLLSERTEPTVLLNCTSASAPFVNKLSGPNRVVVSATKNGGEFQFARFGQFLADSLLAPSTDLDKDGAASALELALEASRRTQAWYVEEGRIATEHALIDDNGDRRGTRADLFDGFRITSEAVKTGRPDGSLARGLTLFRVPEAKELTPDETALRARLEAEIDAMRSARGKQEPSEISLSKLESIFLELAPLYVADVDTATPPDPVEPRSRSNTDPGAPAATGPPAAAGEENVGEPQDAD